MMAAIRSPEPGDTRSTQADWVELQTLLSARGVWTPGDLYGLLDFVEDEAADASPIDEETREVLDESILETQRNRAVDIVFDELQYRNRILGNSYPFCLNTDYLQIERVSDVQSVPGRIVYLFCLLVSAIREKKIDSPDIGKIDESGIPGLFQICACLAAGGYVAGDVASFGFPRPTGSGFLTALRETYRRFGAGKVKAAIPPGFSRSPKDDGIDVIAWRDHPDRLPGKIYLLGQSASGNNWNEKSVIDRIEQFHDWFSDRPATYCVPSMFIPFMLHRDLTDDPGVQFDEVRKSKFLREERRFGIVFDRCRMAHFADTCLQMDDAAGDVDGIGQYAEVETWVMDTWENLRAMEPA